MVELPLIITNMKFDYFDIFAISWLIIGLFWGRKKGISQELLPLMQWLAIVTAGGLLYEPFGSFLHHHTFFSALWSYITAYLLIAAVVHVIYFWLKQVLGPKLGEKNLFGTSEFYLGMTAGAMRFGCMLLAVMALMNSRIVSEAELAKTEKFQKENFSDIRFPTYGGFQQDVLFKSFLGSWARSNLKTVLIASVAPAKKPEVQLGAPKMTNMIAAVPAPPSKK
jgi:Colicin V production protein